MEHNSQLDMERREARRKRRTRNQIAAYAALLAMIALVAAGVVLGVKFITESAAKEKPEESNQAMLESIMASETAIETPEPEETIPELTPEEKLDEIVMAGIEVMPLEDKVAGLFVVQPEAITGVSTAIRAGEGTKEALSKYAVGGLVYFTKNMDSKEQLTEMLDNTRLYTNYPLFLAVDEEGGSVSRLAEAGLVDKVDSAASVAQTGDVNNAYQAGAAIGAYLAEYGFNLNFAPVADIASAENSVLKDRVYGSEADSAAPFVTSMLQGLQEQNVTGCLKHFPGIGSSVEDTHDGMASTERSLEDFRANEFTVFQAGIDSGAQMVMMSHISAPALTGDNTPCSLSKTVVTDMLRGELGFDGVIITDAMNMGAITEYYESDVAAVMALRAGCDMILMPEDFEKAYQGVLQAVQDGTISEDRINDSLKRIYRIKYADKLEQ